MFPEKYMVTLLGIILCFCVLMDVTNGAQAIRKPVPKPAEFANQEGCYDPDLKIVLSVEVPYFTHNCSRFVCKNNGDIVISNCGVVYVSEGQVLLKGNKSLPYPDCCDSVDNDMSHQPKNP